MSYPLSPIDVQKGIRNSIWDGMFAQPFYGVTWPGNVFLTGLALLLGCNAFQIGIIAAIGPLLSAVYLPAARLLERAGRRKPYYLSVVLVHRSVYFLLLILPFFAAQMSPSLQRWLLVAVVFVSQFFGIFNSVAWMSWMSDIIPEDRRGAFFGRRNMLCGGLWMGLSYLVGKFVDAHKTLGGYTVVYAIATVLALVALIFAMRQPDPPLAVSDKRPSLSELWKGIYGSRGFRNFLLFQVAWGFTTSLAGPFYNVYMLDNLHITLAKITLWGIISGIVSTITQPYWGTLGDRAGNRDAMRFEDWVKLLDSSFTTQLEAIARISPRTGTALLIVDYYARHCPSPTEPDMDKQEFLLALYAFRSAQTDVYRLVHGTKFGDSVITRLGDLSRVLDVGA